MTALIVVIGVVIVLTNVAIALLVLSQEAPSQGGLNALSGGGDSFFSRNQNRTKEAMVSSLTKYAAILFFVLSIAMQFIIMMQG